MRRCEKRHRWEFVLAIEVRVLVGWSIRLLVLVLAVGVDVLIGAGFLLCLSYFFFILSYLAYQCGRLLSSPNPEGRFRAARAWNRRAGFHQTPQKWSGSWGWVFGRRAPWPYAQRPNKPAPVHKQAKHIVALGGRGGRPNGAAKCQVAAARRARGNKIRWSSPLLAGCPAACWACA